MILKSFFLLFIFFAPVLIAQDEDLNKTLRDELGVDLKEKKKKEKSEVPPSKEEKKETNPVQERYANSEEGSSTTLLWILVRIFFILAILVGAFYYVLQFLNRNRNAKYPVKGEMRLLSHLPLGPGKELQIVEVSGMLFVLGVSENSVTLLKEITDPMIKERILTAKESYEPPVENFLEQLYGVVKGKTSSKPTNPIETVEEEEEMLDEIQKRQKARLEEMKKERYSIQKKESGKNPKNLDN